MPRTKTKPQPEPVLDGPVVCKPLGTLPLSEIPGFPAATARHVADLYDLRTLEQVLEWSFGKHPPAKWDAAAAETIAVKLTYCRVGPADADLGGRAVVALLTLQPPPKPETASSPQSLDAGGPEPRRDGPAAPDAAADRRHGAAVPEPAVAGVVEPADAAPKRPRRAVAGRAGGAVVGTADDFDESTPPPRARPQGEPLGRFVTLPPGESVVGWFAAMDAQGRVPVGSFLALHAGRPWLMDEEACSGYTLVAGVVAGVAVGEFVPADVLDPLVGRVVVRQKGRRDHVVFSPRGRP